MGSCSNVVALLCTSRAVLTDCLLHCLQDNHGPAYYECGGKSGFLGPWIRWAVIRRNSFAGVSLAAKAHANPPACGAVTLTGASSDIVAEQDIFECEEGAVPGSYEGDIEQCEHCSFRQ